MPDSGEYLLLDAVRDRLAGVTPGNGYTYDLSATDQIVIGDAPVYPDRLPMVSVAYVRTEQQHGRALGQYVAKTTVLVGAVATYTADLRETRAKAALDLASDIRQRLEGDRTVAGYADDIIVTRVYDLSGDEPDIEVPVVQVLVEAVIDWTRNAGSR